MKISNNSSKKWILEKTKKGLYGSISIEDRRLSIVLISESVPENFEEVYEFLKTIQKALYAA